MKEFFEQIKEDYDVVLELEFNNNDQFRVVKHPFEYLDVDIVNTPHGRKVRMRMHKTNIQSQTQMDVLALEIVKVTELMLRLNAKIKE